MTKKPIVKPELEAPVLQRRQKAQRSYLDDRGHEMPDPTPMAPPVGYVQTPSLSDQIRAMVISEKLRAEAEEAGMETFEEADDFEVGEDYEPSSPYEDIFEPLPDVPPETKRMKELAQHIADALRPPEDKGGDTPPSVSSKKPSEKTTEDKINPGAAPRKSGGGEGVNPGEPCT